MMGWNYDGRDRLAEDVGFCGDAESGRRAAVLDMRLDHGPQRLVLRVLELRHDVGMRVSGRQSGVFSRESQSIV
jgi:hypothetical protein